MKIHIITASAFALAILAGPTSAAVTKHDYHVSSGSYGSSANDCGSAATLDLANSQCVPLDHAMRTRDRHGVLKLSTADMAMGTGGSGTPASARPPHIYRYVASSDPNSLRGTGGTPANF
jgi:hypothetical protein